MGVSSSSQPKQGQKYQNNFQFKHNKSSKLTKKILQMPITGLCIPCEEKIKWRKTFRKYKPLTVPKKCVKCFQNNINEAYHIVCRNCAKVTRCCEKCLQPITRLDASNPSFDDKQANISSLAVSGQTVLHIGDSDSSQECLLSMDDFDTESISNLSSEDESVSSSEE